MILPMMGFLFALVAFAVLFAAVCFATPRLRPLAPFGLFPFAAAVVAFISCWGLAVGLEQHFGENAGGVGFFGGYVFGGLTGGVLGYVAALRVRARVA